MVPGEPLSSSWLAKHHRTSHFANVRSQPNAAGKREGETNRMRKPCASRQLEACFARLSGRIGSAALCAPVAQRIERRFPKPCEEVRVLSGAPLSCLRFSAFSFLMPTFRISIFPIPQKSTCARWSDVLTMAPQFQSVTPYDSPWILRETGRRRGLWRIPGKLGAEGARRNTWSQAFR